MSSIIADYTSGANLLEGLHAFLTKGHTLRPTFTGTGNGYCDDAIGTTSSVHEIITLTFTADTLFNVSGSVSGAMGTGSTGVLFTHARFQCTIQVGTVAWVAGDTITWAMTAPWESLIYTSGQSYIYQAPGNDNNQEVNIGWTVKSNSTGGYYGVRVGAYPTLLSNSVYWKQNTTCWLPLGSYSGSSVRLIAVASGEACWICARIGTYYLHAIAGFAEIAGTFSETPLPYLIGGAMSWDIEPTDTSSTWMHTSAKGGPLYITGFSNTDSANDFTGGYTLYYRSPWNKWCTVYNIVGTDSQYRDASDYRTYAASFAPASVMANLDGSIPCWPFLIDRRPGGTYPNSKGAVADTVGRIPFVWRIPGYDSSGNLLTSESTFRSESRTKIAVLQTGSNSSEAALFALEIF